MRSDFAVFILTYGRPDKVITVQSLKKSGYTGKIYFICSTDDSSLFRYKELYGENVITFNKNDYKGKFDIGDNFENDKVVVFARNAVFDIAKKLKLNYFLVLDDDYNIFEFKIPTEKILKGRRILDINNVFLNFINLLENTPTTSIAFAQGGGDFIGGKDNPIFTSLGSKRKLMNCFFNKTDRPYNFYGRINEDVNCYIQNGKTGILFFTHPNISITQCTTQTNSGGLTDFYLETGTYIKSFYTVIFNPSAVKIKEMGATHKRLHHSIKWKNAVPVIINEKYKKQ